MTCICITKQNLIYMKTKLVTVIKAAIVILVFNCTSSSGLKAQVFNVPSAYENIYPLGIPSGDLPSCYSWGGATLSGIVGDIYLSAVNKRVVYRFTKPNTPSVIYTQGTLAYPNCEDISVGYIVDTTGGGWVNEIVVSYYKNGIGPSAGHYYDVYKWTFGSITLVASTQLDNMLNYTRISMDSHFFYGIVITWETPNGLYALTGLWGLFTAPVYLNGTGGFEKPDVAFSHTSSGLLCQFVYDDPSMSPSYTIYETMIGFYPLHAAIGSITPFAQDTNYVTAVWSGVLCSIDAPDHYTVDNWAYTYALDGADVYVRYTDYNTSSVGTTNVVNGTLGNAATYAKELRSKIAYNKSCTSFHVSWYSTDTDGTNGACYFTEEIAEDGVTLVSNVDYELIAANSAFPAGASLNSVTFSKQNDNSPFFYAVFLDNSGIHHSFHNWTNIANWKTTLTPQIAFIKDNCQNSSSSQITSVPKLLSKSDILSAGPNPFTQKIKLQVSASLNDEILNISVNDITGRNLLNYTDVASKASAELEKATMNLIPGTYFVTAKLPKSGKLQTIKLIKSAGN